MTNGRWMLVGILLMAATAPTAAALDVQAHAHVGSDLQARADGDPTAHRMDADAAGVGTTLDDGGLTVDADALLGDGARADGDGGHGDADGDGQVATASESMELTETEAAVAQAAGAAGLAVLVGVVVTKLEGWRAALKHGGALLLAPLYSRIDRSEILDHDTRREMHELVKSQPGIAMKSIADAVDVGWGTAVYHLERLEDNGFLSSRKSAGKRRFFAVGSVDPDVREGMGLLRAETPQRISDFLVREPGAMQKDVCEALDIAPSTASKHLSRMEDAGLVRRERDWRKVHYYPSETLAPALAAAGHEVPETPAVATAPAPAAEAVPA